ncbi:DNA internalization-related competence protein ComEC/Rec2 [Aneurinibacillus tyrosinisolvens]|uniref:DNA internalization-related competence protein ComEC/Rec2 n=1 Tax=Aneurinibacillus tyrosinisolvens TaxID=1443435 RepID=UPI0009E64082|nr:DNA internalization-related competence protein ComEC/Rec2 [Aneurinibacillus tyrosinisolvens]
MRQRALFLYGLCMLGGLVSASQFINSARSGLLLLILCLTITAAALWRYREHRWNCILCFFFLIGGFTYYIWVDTHNVSVLPDKKAAFEGVIKSAPEYDGDRSRFIIEITGIDGSSIQPKEKVQTTLYFHAEHERTRAEKLLTYGTELAGEIELSLPADPTNPGAFDYPEFLHWQRIHKTGKITEVQSLIYRKPAALSINRSMIQARTWLTTRLSQLYSNETEGLLAGMLLGSEEEIDPELYTSFSSLGLTHVIAISGQHISLLVIALVYLLCLCGMGKERAYMITAVILPVYVLMTGASASAMRALIMGELVLGALLMRRFHDGWNSIGAAFLMMALYDPYCIHQVGFQLSFLVTFGLLVFVPRFNSILPIKQEALKSLVAVTVTATIVSFPLTIYYFHVYAYISPLINFVFVPFISIIIAPLAAVSLLLGAIHPAFGLFLANVVDVMLTPVLQFLYVAETWYTVRGVFSSPSAFWLCGYMAWIVFLACSLYGKIIFNWKIVTAHIFIPLTLFCLLLTDSHPGDSVLITFLDVGQGDAIVIETPGKVVVIDGGGPMPRWNEQPWQKRRNNYNPVKEVVMPYLYYRGIKQVDLLVLTHGDSDHVGGIPYLLSHMPVRQVMVNSRKTETSLMKEIFYLLNKGNIPVVAANSGQSWKEGDFIRWHVLNPNKESTGESRNDSSVVLLLEAYGRKLLLTGDLEQQGEERILRETDIHNVDILKAGHHGSRSSTSEPWVLRTHPVLTVISVGKKNRYGHPHAEVIERLIAHSSKVLRTDECGAIVVQIERNGFVYKPAARCRATAK